MREDIYIYIYILCVCVIVVKLKHKEEFIWYSNQLKKYV